MFLSVINLPVAGLILEERERYKDMLTPHAAVLESRHFGASGSDVRLGFWASGNAESIATTDCSELKLIFLFTPFLYLVRVPDTVL